jgi:L-alanine-DL-glutamate epimerase-like enolase superfamily enzyme
MQRRNFLKTSASAAVLAGTMPACATTNSHEEPVIAHQGRTADYRPFSIIEPGLKITKIETWCQPSVAVVRVTADNSMEGWGQISTYDADISAMVLHRKIASHVLGADPAHIDDLADLCVERNLKFPWSYVLRAFGGVETALWDLYGKIRQQPVCELLGGEVKPVPIYGSSMSRSINAADEVERFTRLRDEKGIKAFKFRIGKEAGRNGDAWPGRTEEMIRGVGSALAESCTLLSDANSCYTPDRAIEVGKMLQDCGISQYEEPCPYWEIEWTARVTAALDLKVSGGEQDNDLAQWRRIISIPTVDIIQPDPLYLGGVVRTVRAARMAEAKGIPCVPHSANLCMVTVFALHIMRAIPNAGPSLEYTIEEEEGINQTARELYSPALEIVDGALDMTSAPGWGIEFNPEWLDRANYQVSDASS